MSPSRSSDGARLADSADMVTVERSSEPPVSMLRAEPLLRLGDLLRSQASRAFVEHRHDHRLQPARVRRVGGIAGIERQRQLGHRHRGALRILQLDAVRQAWHA